MMVEFQEIRDNNLCLVDPVDGNLITSTRVPEFLRSHERYGPGLEYLQRNAGSIAVSLHLISHHDAVDLGSDFEDRLATHNTIAIEHNGWSEKVYSLIQSLSNGLSLEEFAQALGRAGYREAQAEAEDEARFGGRLYHAIEDSGVDVCIGDIPERHAGNYEFEVHRLWHGAYYDENFYPALYHAAVALREWFMVANLGVHLNAYSRPDPKILYPVGANHFMLQDKFMTVGILPEVTMLADPSDTTNPADPTSKLLALRNVGQASLTGLDRLGQPLIS